MTYKQWLTEIDDLLWGSVGAGIDDLPDCCYLAWYEAGIDPVEATERVKQGAL